MVDIKAIKARMDKATPGPWRWTTHGADILVSDSEDVLGPVMSGVEVISSPETAEFIAAAPTDVRNLVAEVAKLRKVYEAAKYYQIDCFGLGPDEVIPAAIRLEDAIREVLVEE